jgi:hypothetical protein
MDLRKLCRPDNGPYLRPFQPNANWESAKVFIVGTNPSREIGPADCEYDDFIDSVLGNGQLFDSIYSSKGESKTRDYMQSLINGISANTLITNLYWRPTRKAKFLTESDKDTALFFQLLRHVKPRVLVVHGKPAATQFNVNTLTPIWDQDKRIEIPGAQYKTSVFAYPHLSGLGWNGFRSRPNDMADLAKRVMSVVNLNR